LEDWFSPQEVATYEPKHIYWVLTKLVDHIGYSWPCEPKTSYNAGGKKSLNTQAVFITVSEAYAELESRISLIELSGKGAQRLDGEKMVQQIVAGKELNYNSLGALYYCTGKRRKIMPYSEWRKRYGCNSL